MQYKISVTLLIQEFDFQGLWNTFKKFNVNFKNNNLLVFIKGWLTVSVLFTIGFTES